MKKILLLTILFGITSLYAQDILTADEVKAQDLQRAAYHKMMDGKKTILDDKEFNMTSAKALSDLNKAKANYNNAKMSKPKQARTDGAFSSKIIVILRKLNVLEKDAIDQKDYRKLIKYNTLSKCLLVASQEADIKLCKRDFQSK